jgi:hypothetical protein
MAVFANPAGLAATEQGNVALGHVAWLQDVNLEYGSIAFPINERWTVNASVVYLGFGEVTGYDIYGDPTGSVPAYDFMGALSAAVMVIDRWSVGLTVEYIRQQLDRHAATAFAADLGVQYQSQNWTVGVVVSDVGNSVKFLSVDERLPSAVRIGFSVRPFASDVTWATDFSKQFHGGSEVGNGFEYGYNEKYFWRGGMRLTQYEASPGWKESFSTGFGLRFGSYEIDYSFVLGNSITGEDLHRFSVGLDF